MANCKKCGQYFKREKAEYLCKECKTMKIETRNTNCKKVLNAYYKNIEKRRKYQRERYWKKRDELLEYQNKWNGQEERLEILERDKHKCQKCGVNKNLVIHHIDGKGVFKHDTNNNWENRITWCQSCHCRHHMSKY